MSEEPDRYDYEHRVDGVVELLNEVQLPFVMALEGEWGRGKSTFLRLILRRLRADRISTARGWKVVHYHPWRYDIHEFSDAWESLVEVLSEELGTPSTRTQRATELVTLLRENRISKLLGGLAVVAAGVVPGGGPVATGLKDLASVVADAVKDPTQLGKRYLLFERIRRKVGELTGQRPLLLVIDDLDRCSPAAVCHVLRCIPTLFAPNETGPQVAVLLALDRKATVEALRTGQGLDPTQAEGLLEKLIHVHVTLPILQLGRGDVTKAREKIVRAVTDGGHRKRRTIRFPGTLGAIPFEISPVQVDAIARVLSYNPRKLERFCLLFDLKWKTRVRSNSRSYMRQELQSNRAADVAEWLRKFRDLLIWESLVELRWPLYDAKTGDINANQQAIERALRGEPALAEGLPCKPYLEDPRFLEVHRMRDAWRKGQYITDTVG